MINKFKLFILNGKDERSGRIRLYTIFNIIFKGLGVICSFLIIPLSLSYINKSEYGVWLTLTSIVSWLSYMDVGLGNGLRNKLAEAAALNNKTLAKEYISTTYIAFAVFVGFVFLLFVIINNFLNWNEILKTTIQLRILLLSTYVVLFCFCLRLQLSLAMTVCTAMQKNYVESLINFSINLFTLIALWILTKFSDPSFLSFVIWLSIIPILVLIILNYYLFNVSNLSHLAPAISSFKKEYLKPLLNIGLQFFFIQLVGIIIFSTDNILITQFLSPADVTVFNIAYKYFSIVTLIFTIILFPYWSAFTNAFIKKDLIWIKSSFKKLIMLWFIQVIGVIVLIILSKYIYLVWVGKDIRIPNLLTITLGIYCIIFNWNNVFAYFINGISKIRLQLLSSVIVGIVNIPLSIYLIKYSSFGISSIVIANILCLIVGSVWAPIQVYKILNNKAYGIWNK